MEINEMTRKQFINLPHIERRFEMKLFLENPKDFTIIVKDIPNEEQTDQITLQQAFWLQNKIEKQHYNLKEK